MKFRAIPIMFAAALATAGCQNLTAQDQANLGLAAGAGAGLLLADAFDANPAWTVVSALGGAAIGQQVARNQNTNQCAYYAGTNAQGQAVYRTGPC
jgi:osmotically inducible lipoprotein OsmB